MYLSVLQEVRGYLAIEEGVTRLVWPEGSHLVFVGTKVGRIAVCDVRAINRVMTLEGHRQSILDIVITAYVFFLFVNANYFGFHL